MRLNKAGLIFCGIYIPFAALLFFISYSSQDTKSIYFASQIAVLPGVMLLEALGLQKWVIAHPWANSTPLFFLLSVVLCYLAGWGCSGLARLVGRPAKTTAIGSTRTAPKPDRVHPALVPRWAVAERGLRVHRDEGPRQMKGRAKSLRGRPTRPNP